MTACREGLARRQPASRALACVLALALEGIGAMASAQQPPAAPGGGLVIYPARSQDSRQLDRDKYECYDWARGQTGFDPAQASPPSAPAATARSNGGSAAGMAKGAMGGAALAELSNHDAGKGAAAGVLGATVMDRVKQHQSAQSTRQQAAQAQAARSQQRDTYARAFGACLEARGYVVR